MTILRYITFEEAKKSLPKIKLDKSFPSFLNKDIGLYKDQYNNQFLLLTNWYDEEEFVKI
jgi:hypothetical protein